MVLAGIWGRTTDWRLWTMGHAERFRNFCGWALLRSMWMPGRSRGWAGKKIRSGALRIALDHCGFGRWDPERSGVGLGRNRSDPEWNTAEAWIGNRRGFSFFGSVSVTRNTGNTGNTGNTRCARGPWTADRRDGYGLRTTDEDQGPRTRGRRSLPGKGRDPAP